MKLKIIWFYIEIGYSKLLNIFNVKRNTSLIPKGMYCYTFDGTSGTDDSGYTWFGTNSCKYYRSMKGMKAGCTYIGFIGWDPCLGDQCKICGENKD